MNKVECNVKCYPKIDFSQKPTNQKKVNFDTININSSVIVYIRNDNQYYRIVVVTENNYKYTISASASSMCSEEFGDIYGNFELNNEEEEEEQSPHYHCFPTDMNVSDLPANFINTKINLKEIKIYELSLFSLSSSNSKLIYEFVLNNGNRYFLGHYNFHNGYYPRYINITFINLNLIEDEQKELPILKTFI